MPALAVICLGPGERVLATAHMAAGRLDDAVDWLRAALIADQRLGNRPFEALILAQLASVLARRRLAGDRAEAADLYASAIALGDEMKMTERVSRWKQEAAELGGVPRIGCGAARHARRAWRHVVHRDRWKVDNDRSPERDAVRGRADLPTGHRHRRLLAQRRGDRATWRAEDLWRLGARCRKRAATTSGGSTQLDRELDTADLVGDPERSHRAATERDQIIQQLRRDVGLGGRTRRLNDDAERSRMRVSKAIQRAIRQIETADPVLGRALRTRIHTGFFCRYIPDPGQPIVWTVQKAPAARVTQPLTPRSVSHRDTHDVPPSR